jgi:hypothetical protein
MEHDSTDLDKWIIDVDAQDMVRGRVRDEPIDFGLLSASERVSGHEKARAETYRNEIAQAMWTDYQRIIRERAADLMDVDMPAPPGLD